MKHLMIQGIDVFYEGELIGQAYKPAGDCATKWVHALLVDRRFLLNTDLTYDSQEDAAIGCAVDAHDMGYIEIDDPVYWRAQVDEDYREEVMTMEYEKEAS